MESCEAVSPLHKRLIHGVSPNCMHGDTKPVVAARCKVKSTIDESSSKSQHDELCHDCAMCSECDSTDKGRDDGRVSNAARVKRVAFNERASNFAAKDESLSGSKPEWSFYGWHDSHRFFCKMGLFKLCPSLCWNYSDSNLSTI